MPVEVMYFDDKVIRAGIDILYGYKYISIELIKKLYNTRKEASLRKGFD